MVRKFYYSTLQKQFLANQAQNLTKRDGHRPREETFMGGPNHRGEKRERIEGWKKKLKGKGFTLSSEVITSHFESSKQLAKY